MSSAIIDRPRSAEAVEIDYPLFPSLPGSASTAAVRLRTYSNTLTADVNQKGVLDVDTVKGCTAGMTARPDRGCYNACYAENIARFRGMDFSRAVVRKVFGPAHAERIVRAVKAAPQGFFRIGTMGDPCHAWEHTVGVVEWLAPYAVPVIVTKHWYKASNDHFRRLVACGTVLNTSVSGLDTQAELAHREKQIARYADLGGLSVARVVSCDFDDATPEGARMAAIQTRLFALRPIIDNPLRVPRTHPLVQSGVIRVQVVQDLASMRTVSIARADAYVGHCGTCPDQCGLSSIRDTDHPKPQPPQLQLFQLQVKARTK